MKKKMLKYAAFVITALCIALLLPTQSMAAQLPLSDYDNLPEGYMAMGTEDEARSMSGSNSYQLVIIERVRDLESEYSRDIFYDFYNLPNETYQYNINKKEFENRTALIVQTPGVAMTFHYTDMITGPEEFLNQYTMITDEEYRNKDAMNWPDAIKLDTIGGYRAVHSIITYEEVEGYFQNDHWFIPLQTPTPHYGTVYIKLNISNEVEVSGDLTVEEIPDIYEQWLAECLETTENWVDEMMKFSYTVRADEYEIGQISDVWQQPGDEQPGTGEPETEDPVIEEPHSENEPDSSAAPQPGEQDTPSGEQEADMDPVSPADSDSTTDSTKEEIGSTDTGDDSDDYADPAEAAIITIISILMAILFGGAGGTAPNASAPAGTGGTPISSPAEAGVSKWLQFDNDGDIEATDPVNGQKRTYVHNGDGTYTNPITGATYTPDELSAQMEHRAANADTIRQDEAQFTQNVREDNERNLERSDESRQLEEDLQRERQERLRKEKIERIAVNLGISGASEDEVRQELQRRLERDEEFRQKMNEYAGNLDDAVDILEATVDIADYAMAAGEAVVPGGKAVSATYKGIKNIGSTVAEKGLSTGSVIEGAIKGGTEAAGTLMDAGVGKAATTFGGTVAGEVAEAINEGEDLTSAAMEGFVKGAVNTATGAVGDAYGDMVQGDSLLNTAAEAAGKIGETGFSKEVADPAFDELLNKDK